MNPMTWRREHQVALLLGIVLGIVLGLLLGFMYEGIHLATMQERWSIASRFRWAILGALVGACVISIQRLLRT
jgi:H+/Cl- antiporter ClcA